MDIENIRNIVKARYNHNVARLALKERFQAKLLITHNNGTWTISPSLISTLACESLGDSPIIADDYNKLVKINRRELLDESISRWNTVSAEWLEEQTKIDSER